LKNCRKAFRPKTRNTSPSNLTVSTTIFMRKSPVKFSSLWAQQKRASPTGENASSAKCQQSLAEFPLTDSFNFTL
jgi:hypothetical protein